MATIAVHQLRTGDKLDQDILTMRKNILLPKGTLISERELAILEAFMIQKVSIESRPGLEDEMDSAQKKDVSATENAVSLSFHHFYEQMLELLKKTFLDAKSGFPLAVMGIRSLLGQLIANIKYFNELTYKPVRMAPEDYYFHKSIMVSLTSYLMAVHQGLPAKDHIPVAMAGLLHDIGNSRIVPALLIKKGKLTADEFEEIKKHPILGYKYVKKHGGN